ncbi:MAG TPA: hypothetical protein VFU31_14805 [Candidatus Binatia bacterium]|nr:hypothetical protein [Candidatus Binatia bacterium]
MQQPLRRGSQAILVEDKKLKAAKCEKCGVKIYPPSLLKPHLDRHQSQHRWFLTELKKLRRTMSHMREIA